MKRTIMRTIFYASAFIVIVYICIGSFQLSSTMNYNFGYKAKVQKTVREMVKDGALK